MRFVSLYILKIQYSNIYIYCCAISILKLILDEDSNPLRVRVVYEYLGRTFFNLARSDDIHVYNVSYTRAHEADTRIRGYDKYDASICPYKDTLYAPR